MTARPESQGQARDAAYGAEAALSRTNPAVSRGISDASGGFAAKKCRCGWLKLSPVTGTCFVEQATVALTAKREHSYNRRETLVEFLVREEIEKAIRGDLKKAMEAARKQVRAAIEQQGAEILADAVKAVTGVRV